MSHKEEKAASTSTNSNKLKKQKWNYFPNRNRVNPFYLTEKIEVNAKSLNPDERSNESQFGTNCQVTPSKNDSSNINSLGSRSSKPRRSLGRGIRSRSLARFLEEDKPVGSETDEVVISQTSQKDQVIMDVDVDDSKSIPKTLEPDCLTNNENLYENTCNNSIIEKISEDINPICSLPEGQLLSPMLLMFSDFCEVGNDIKVDEILTNGYVSVNDTLIHDWSGLMLACYNGRVKVAKYLLSKGADPNFRRERDNFTTMMATAYCNFHEDKGAYECAKLILEAGGRVNEAQPNGTTPLILSVRQNHVQIARILIEHGADINFADKNGRTALDWATIKENECMKQLLLEYAAAGATTSPSDVFNI